MNLINIIDYDEGIKKLARYALERKLVPVFGAGFTAGCQAVNGGVPDGKLAKNEMSKLICAEKNCLYSYEEVNKKSFFDVSDLFFECVSSEKRAKYFEDNFTEVKLLQQQIDFLTKVNWPYAYTLNVDDGIEQNSDFQLILPYLKFRRPKTSKKLLYKLHGDVNYESRYRDDNKNNIVFSQEQYLQAITSEENKDIYKALLSDYAQQHMLFIGCSLQNEMDLQYVYNKSKNIQQDAYRIVLRNEKPTLDEERSLKKHGINGVIIVENFEKFYPDFVSMYQYLERENREKIYKYINPSIIIEKGKKESLKLISNTKIFDTQKNAFLKSTLHIYRDCNKEIQDELDKTSFVLLKGRRFSGKTYVLCNLAEYYKKRDVFYFPSEIFVDEELILKILESQKDSIFLFDSNSMSSNVYGLLIDLRTRLNNNNNKVVIAINSSDNYLVSNLNCNVIDISNRFDENEIVMSNKVQDSFGLVRRKADQTNIDYLYVLKKDQNINIPFTIKKEIKISLKERSVLIALCALDKLYYSDLISLDLNRDEINDICKKFSPFVELILTTEEEATKHSSSKMVHNSKSALIELLKQFQIQEISDSIYYIVKEFKLDYSRKRLYIDIILFDTLNQIFSTNKDSKSLIYTIYKDLQPLLENDLHYWLQRAKSIYRTQDNVESFEEAYTYAKKAYIDGKGALVVKAALTTALISCAIAEKKPEKDKMGYYIECVFLAHTAVFSDYFHLYPTYLNSELPIGKNTTSERRITEACEYICKNCEQSGCERESRELLEYFERKEYIGEKYNVRNSRIHRR